MISACKHADQITAKIRVFCSNHIVLCPRPHTCCFHVHLSSSKSVSSVITSKYTNCWTFTVLKYSLPHWHPEQRAISGPLGTNRCVFLWLFFSRFVKENGRAHESSRLFSSASKIFHFQRLSGYSDAHFRPSQRQIRQEQELRAVQVFYLL